LVQVVPENSIDINLNPEPFRPDTQTLNPRKGVDEEGGERCRKRKRE
jgi:hypothetical protein